MAAITAGSAPAGSGPPPRLHGASARRNALATPRRRWRWRHARDAAWTLPDRHVGPGAAVSVVGAGNGHDLPLARLARRAGRLDLVDIDGRALRRARRRLRLAGGRPATFTADITGGSADAIVANAIVAGAAAARPRTPPPPPDTGRADPLPPGGRAHDVIVLDLVLSQLLYPALADARLPGAAIDRTLLAHGQALTDRVVADPADAAVPGALLVCIEDLLGRWPGHDQPFTIHDMLALAALDPDRALRRAREGRPAYGCDGRVALAAAGVETVDRAWWRWPFAYGTDYLVCATVGRVP